MPTAVGKGSASSSDPHALVIEDCNHLARICNRGLSDGAASFLPRIRADASEEHRYCGPVTPHAGTPRAGT